MADGKDKQNIVSSDIDLGDLFKGDSVQVIDENARLVFAKQILFGLLSFAVLYLLLTLFIQTTNP